MNTIYHVGHRQPGGEPIDWTTLDTRDAALAQNRLNAEEALAGLTGTDEHGGEWSLSQDEDGDYFVTLVRNGEDVFAWHYFVEECQHNPGEWNGQRFWSGMVHLASGSVVSVYTYEQAEEVDFMVPCSTDIYDEFDDGVLGYFFINDGVLSGERRETRGQIVAQEDLSPETLDRIRQQVRLDAAAQQPDPRDEALRYIAEHGTTLPPPDAQEAEVQES